MGKLFVVESGCDASGKATQSRMLFEALRRDGFNVRKIEFPNYKSDSSALVKMYLNGDFGEDPEDVSPYISSTFFAVDRYATYKKEWEEFYKSGGIVIADRYTTSNMVHQAAKFDDDKKRDEFLSWLDDLEFGIYSLPRPDMVFFLNMPVNFSSDLMKNRKNKITGEHKKDIHESNTSYLQKSYDNALEVAKANKWMNIDCTKDGSLIKIDEIHTHIYNGALELLGEGGDSIAK